MVIYMNPTATITIRTAAAKIVAGDIVFEGFGCNRMAASVTHDSSGMHGCTAIVWEDGHRDFYPSNHQMHRIEVAD
jgi:hypothetical protein